MSKRAKAKKLSKEHLKCNKPRKTPNYKTLHEALPPISGDKYIITKWWRSWSLI